MRLSPVPPRPTAPVVIPQDEPVYRLKGDYFGPDDVIYPEGSILAIADEPNQEMEPLNDLARAAMRAYLKKLDGYGRAAAEKVGKGYSGLEDAFANSLELNKQEGRRVHVINDKGAVPMMRANKQGKAVKKIDLSAEAAPEVVKVSKKNTPSAVNKAAIFE